MLPLEAGEIAFINFCCVSSFSPRPLRRRCPDVSYAVDWTLKPVAADHHFQDHPWKNQAALTVNWLVGLNFLNAELSAKMCWRGQRSRRWGKREIIYLSLHRRHQNDSCIKTGSDESHFNVLLIVRDKVTRQCPQITTFLKREESRSGIDPRSFCLPA